MLYKEAKLNILRQCILTSWFAGSLEDEYSAWLKDRLADTLDLIEGEILANTINGVPSEKYYQEFLDNKLLTTCKKLKDI